MLLDFTTSINIDKIIKFKTVCRFTAATLLIYALRYNKSTEPDQRILLMENSESDVVLSDWYGRARL
jgi:hypothetical protein